MSPISSFVSKVRNRFKKIASYSKGLAGRFSRRYKHNRRAGRFRKDYEKAARSLKSVQDNSGKIGKARVVVGVLVTPGQRLTAHFLAFYRKAGAAHFLVIDASRDAEGHAAGLGAEDVSIWTTSTDVATRGNGAPWFNALFNRHAVGRMVVAVEADQYFVYPHDSRRKLPDLAQFLVDDRKETIHAVIVDAYAGPGSADPAAGDLFAAYPFIDRDGYSQRSGDIGTTIIRGGPFARTVHANAPATAPELNRIPALLWEKDYNYRRSTQSMWPNNLNRAHKNGEVSLSGVLIRLPSVPPIAGTRAWHTPGISERWSSSDQLIELGLMNPGHWV